MSSGPGKMYITIELTAIKDGAEWHRATLRNPGLNESAYTELQKRLIDTLIALGFDVAGMGSMPTTTETGRK